MRQMDSGALGSNGGMKFELQKDSRVNNGLTRMIRELNIAVPEAVDMWPRIGRVSQVSEIAHRPRFPNKHNRVAANSSVFRPVGIAQRPRVPN